MFQILYLFKNDNHELVEVKKTDVANDCPPEKKYYWLFLHKLSKKVEKLEFKSMGEEDGWSCRNFSNANLKFNSKEAELSFSKTEIYNFISASEMDKEQKTQVAEYLFEN